MIFHTIRDTYIYTHKSIHKYRTQDIKGPKNEMKVAFNVHITSSTGMPTEMPVLSPTPPKNYSQNESPKHIHSPIGCTTFSVYIELMA